MKVFAIDPGFGRCGVAVVMKDMGKERVLYSDCIETSSKLPFLERLRTVVEACERIIHDEAPKAVAIEKLYFATNQKTAMQVSEVRGALLSLAAQHHLPTYEYTPMQVKAALGYGKADKKQIAKMIHMLVSIDKKIRHDDEYDAIAIAVTHFAHAK